MIGSLVRTSKLAKRLARTFMILVAVPLLISALVLGRVDREQMIWTARAIENINGEAVNHTSHEFQELGRQAVRRSSTETQRISIAAVKSVSNKIQEIQASSLEATADAFSVTTRRSLDDALRQSIATNEATLATVRDKMTFLFERSSQLTAQRAAGRVEAAMLRIIETEMQERAEHLTGRASGQIKNAPRYLGLTAQAPEMRNGDMEGQRLILDSLVRRFPEFTEVSVLDHTGKETASSASDHVVSPRNYGMRASEKYFKRAMKGEEYIAQDGLPFTHDAPTLRIAVPIEAYRGKIVGVLAAQYSLEAMWDSIRGMRVGRGGFAYVMDQAGKPLLPPRRSTGPVLTSSADIDFLKWTVFVTIPRSEAAEPIIALKRDIRENNRVAIAAARVDIQSQERAASDRLHAAATIVREASARQITDSARATIDRLLNTTRVQTKSQIAKMQSAIEFEAGNTQKQVDQQTVVAAAASAKDFPRRVHPLMTRAVQRADQHITVLTLVITLLSCGAGCLLALVMAGRIVGPLQNLVEGTRALAHGDLDNRVDERAPDEIGDLAVAFNTMAAILQKSRTDLDQAEGQLVQSAKLASLGTLSAGVAHELNQPLAIIRGVAQQLQDEPGISEDMIADLDLIEGQTGRMMKIITHLRTFCRAGTGDAREFDVNKVSADCFILIGEQLRAHNIAVRMDLCEGEPQVKGDPNEIEQVLINLITNARDAIEGVPDAAITLRSRIEGDKLILQVADNGPGIPEEIRVRIFDPFFTTKEPGKGTGLGLSISHTILEKHGGSLSVENDGGAVFTIVLPLAFADAESVGRAA